MGREWYWSRPVSPRPERDATSGCMSGVLNFLDFHQLLFAAGEACTRPPPSSPPRRPPPQHFKPPPTTISPSGLEAPRNSLELEAAPPASSSSTSAAASEDYYFDIPMGIQVPTKTTAPSLFDEERRDSHSQSQSLAATPRTPNVVARLMGLEILPDAMSVSSPPVRTRRQPSRSVPPTPVVAERPESYRRSKRREAPPAVRVPLQPRDINVNLRVETGSRSLPETPRPSSSRPWEADPRLSFQVNKENCHRAMHEFGYLREVSADQYCSPQTTKSRRRENVRPLEESKSPRSQYSPREFVKQVRDSISNKRVSGGGGGGGHAGDENGSRSSRNRQTEKKVLSGVMIPSTCSTHRSRSVEPPLSSPPPPPKSLRTPSKCKEVVESKGINMTPSGCKRASFDRYTEKIKKKNPSPETKKQSRIAPVSGQSSQQLPAPAAAVHRETIKGFMKASTRIRLPMERDPEFRYVRSILEHAGILTPAAHAARWRYSLSLPVDPIIFHQLELELPLLDLKAEGDLGPLRHRWNRKLLFHLVEEVLGDLLSGAGGRRNANAGAGARAGEPLLLRLWGRIRSFPAVDCKVVGDIDALVEGDFREATIRGLLRLPSVAAEAESITAVLVKGILDSLVEEAAASLSLDSAGAGAWKCSCGDQLSLE